MTAMIEGGMMGAMIAVLIVSAVAKSRS